jgi:hypothetical protein
MSDLEQHSSSSSTIAAAVGSAAIAMFSTSHYANVPNMNVGQPTPFTSTTHQYWQNR